MTKTQAMQEFLALWREAEEIQPELRGLPVTRQAAMREYLGSLYDEGVLTDDTENWKVQS